MTAQLKLSTPTLVMADPKAGGPAVACRATLRLPDGSHVPLAEGSDITLTASADDAVKATVTILLAGVEMVRGCLNTTEALAELAEKRDEFGNVVKPFGDYPLTTGDDS